MAQPVADDQEEKPLDPAVERVRRKLVRFVAINLGLLFAALMAVLVAIVYRTGQTEPAADTPAQMLAGTVRLPAGARIVSQSLSGDRIAFDIELAGSNRTILLYDMPRDAIVGRFEIVPE